jgi:hypothetical protein
MSTAFHPQTDGLSKRKNQWVEQYLRLVTSAQQDQWKAWLPIATATHNAHVNATTRKAPIEVLLGFLPNFDPFTLPTTLNPRAEDRIESLRQHREQAIAVLNKTINQPPSNQFEEGDRVWLEARHLNLPYQTRKLAPKRHGPFTITQRISPVAFKLELPPTWTIHDIFHASLLTPYKEMEEYGTNYTRPPLEMEEGEEEYEVEHV